MTHPGSSGLRQDGDTLVVVLSGRWDLEERPAVTAKDVERAMTTRSVQRVTFDAAALQHWGSRLVAFAARVSQIAQAKGLTLEWGDVPPGVPRLLALAQSGAHHEPHAAPPGDGLIARVGGLFIAGAKRAYDILGFVGEAALSIVNLPTGQAHFRVRDLWVHIYQSGARALPIVSVVSLLVGLILTFVGAVQLESFGATIYVADLVGIALVRDIGAIMTAIVLAGRTGASYAAELGTMRVTQETDALTTLGIPVMEFLVLPRIIALTLMLPLLTIYANLMGILGGALVGTALMRIHPMAYYAQTVEAITAEHLWGGLFKATLYGTLVAAAGCFEGLRAQRTAASVGQATTAAVVDGIVLIISACGILSVAFYILGV